MKNAINRALVKLKKDGTYDALVKKWFSGIPGFNIKEAEGEKIKFLLAFFEKILLNVINI